MNYLTIGGIVVASIAYLALSVYACGEYMSSTGRTKLHPLLQVPAMARL